MTELNDHLLTELVDAVKDLVKKEQSDKLRDVYLIGDIEKDSARLVIERLRELANDSRRPITLFVNSAGGNVTDGLALHDAIRHLVTQGHQITIVVQGMAYSMGSIVLQAASPGRRHAFPHSWIMIHEPAKWAGWQSTTAAAQHLDRLKQMQSQIYRILASRCARSFATPSGPTSISMRRRPRSTVSSTRFSGPSAFPHPVRRPLPVLSPSPPRFQPW
jgi:ATP-dependent Clp endopeptidase proteolytic subunit ClpP